MSRDKGNSTDNTVAAKEERADVARVLGFLKRFIEEPEWACERIAACLTGKSGFELESGGVDLISRPLKELKKQYKPDQAREVYEAILREVFHGSGGVEVWEIKNAGGEFDLRLSAVEGDHSPYFGVINIGDSLSFKKHIEERLNIDVHPDTHRGSLFTGIDTANSRDNLLIGAKKFIEGWSSWRVSAMGLMNIGRGEGSQIMQLFSRGIRLKGKDMSLKRSNAGDTDNGDASPGIRELETLYVFGWNADYMSKFQNMIEAEDIPQTYDLPLFQNLSWPKTGMYVPRPTNESNLAASTFVHEGGNGGDVDLTARLTSFTGNIERRAPQALRASGQRVKFIEVMHFIDDGELYAKTLQWAKRRKMGNMFLSRRKFQGLLEASTALVPEGETENSRVLQEAAEHAICDAVKRGFNQWRRVTMTDAMQPEELCVEEMMPEWGIQVNKDSELLNKVEELIANLKRGDDKSDAGEPLPRLHLDCHLYNPLYTQIRNADNNDALNPYMPPGLVESEVEFISRLKAFWRDNCDSLAYRDWELYVLRNPSPGGVALYGAEGKFLPDFILWLKSRKSRQVLVRFIEPHGMRHETVRSMRSKAECFKFLHELNKTVAFRAGNTEMAGWFIATSEKLADIPFAGGRDWKELEKDYCLLRAGDDYLPKILLP